MYHKVMEAILRAYNMKTGGFEDKIVEISDNHDFSEGPYVDTVPFVVGSNQTIIPLDF
jgi:hypothetical protein